MGSFVACVLPGPGPELDAMVDEYLRGRRWVQHPRVCINGTWRDVPSWMEENDDPADPPAGYRAGDTPPAYSRGLNNAWFIVERMRDVWLMLDAYETCYWQFVDCSRHGWRVDIRWAHHDGDQELHSASEMTLPHAICVAVLKWYGVGRGDE